MAEKQERADIKTQATAVMAKHVGRPSGQRLRVTTDRPGQMPVFGRFLSIEAPPTAETDWQVAELDSMTLHRETPERIIELLVDLSPDVNRAHFDWMRELNPGWDFDVFIPGTETRHEQGFQIVEDFFTQLSALYGTPDVPINRMFTGQFMRGAVFSELVIGADRRTMVDLATPDPAIVRFKRRDDPVRGTIFEPGVVDAKQAASWVSYDLPTIKYVPLDPMPGVPYGRAMVSASLYTALFLLGLMHDLRRVIAQQGYPRPDIEIDLEVLAQEMPGDLEEDAEGKAEWVEAIRYAVEQAYAALEPESAFVHTSVVKLNRPMGTLDAESLGGLGSIIEALERMSVRALKTTPFMMAISESTTETQANRQYEQHAQGVRAAQHPVEVVLESHLAYGLRANGILADVQFRFAMNRKGEELRDAMAVSQQIANEREKLAAGWTEQDEAAQEITDHDAAEPEPRDGAWQTAVDIANATTPAEPDTVDPNESDVAAEETPINEGDGQDNAARILAALRRAIDEYGDESGAIYGRTVALVEESIPDEEASWLQNVQRRLDGLAATGAGRSNNGIEFVRDQDGKVNP